MSDQECFVVVGGISYEGSEPLRAFSLEGDAEAFMEECRAYDLTRPIAPGCGAPDDVWKAWFDALKEWEQKHPARSAEGHVSQYDHYDARRIPIKERP